MVILHLMSLRYLKMEARQHESTPKNLTFDLKAVAESAEVETNNVSTLKIRLF